MLVVISWQTTECLQQEPPVNPRRFNDFDAFRPDLLQVTVGSSVGNRIERAMDISGRSSAEVPEFKCWAKSNDVSVIDSPRPGLMDYKALLYRFPAALVVGSGKHGLSDQLLETADFVVRIPMHGGSDSLNAAVAAGVLLFEISGQRKERFGAMERWSPSEIVSTRDNNCAVYGCVIPVNAFD